MARLRTVLKKLKARPFVLALLDRLPVIAIFLRHRLSVILWLAAPLKALRRRGDQRIQTHQPGFPLEFTPYADTGRE